MKTGIEEDAGMMGLSIPTVVFGESFATRAMREKEWTSIEFSVNGRPLDLPVCLQPIHAGG